MSRRIFPTWSTLTLAMLAAAGALVPVTGEAQAQEPASCLSEDPNDWPASSKPYFMIVQDTSGSMVACTNPPVVPPAFDACLGGNTNTNSCGLLTNRVNDSKCALRKTVQAFSGQVNFGLATFARTLSGDNCTVANFPDGDSCGNNPDCDIAPGNGLASPPSFAEGWLNGGNIVVPMKRDGEVDNTGTLLQWFDGSCVGNREIFANGATPIGGSLQSVAQYFRRGWAPWSETNGNYCEAAPGFTQTSPLSAADPLCRSINVILVTDGDDTCGGQAFAVAAATNLFTTGVTFGGKTWPVRTYVINFAGGSIGNTNAIAAAGGTGTALLATNEATLASSLSNIIAGSVAPEVCDNSDNNCNGCTDEGYRHYCNQQQTCCSLARATCLQNYEDSISPGDPDGDLTLLPCTTPAQAAQPANWLCFDPAETCDNNDNNCVDGVDEGVVRCGNPLRCPRPEVCDGTDDDCDGVIDNGVCSGCVPQPEVCDGCDNDCDGIVDNGIGAIVCGVPNPPACAGTRTCTTAQASVAPGQCVGGATFSACSSTGGTETCNGVDEDCDGVIDDGVPPRACVPPGTPGGLVFGAPSQCRQGSQACASNGAFGPCIGFVGQGAEICDGIDNDCDGLLDAADGDLLGAGEECGIGGGQCTPGTTQCIAGALSCVGAVGGNPEICNGLDDDCDGFTDEAPLDDAPGAGETGCWTLAGASCIFENATWNAPPGADCTSLGSLDAPCAAGTLACAGANLWVCQNDVLPAGEACDGIDNNCDGAIDEGDFPGEGEVCGDADPPCTTGMTACQNGFLDCVGGMGPQEEVCDGIDNDCDTEIDEGIIVGTPCTVAYDTEDFPGDRSGSPCQPGSLECDADGGQTCVGGIGPQIEICDGVDNDCDGDVDETGGAPDGIDDSENPFPPPDAAIGEACGNTEGICSEGAWGCLNGRFECLGGQGPQVEVCDCTDNDCNGVNDNENENNTPRLCSEGRDCIKSGDSCQCAAPCGDGEFPCPAGQECITVTSSETGEPLSESYCVADNCQGGCADKTVRDGDENVLCAPAGTSLPDCGQVPECVCKGQSGCQPPCFGVECAGVLTCANFGDATGTCAPNNCLNVGCQGCDTYCSGSGDCIANPCLDPDVNDCSANQVCEPDGEGVSCTGSCAGVDCDAGSVCKDGACVADCAPACSDDQVCDYGQNPATCVDNQCAENACPNGGCCDPVTGACGACPCEGVICPQDQVCVDDECVEPGTSGAGGGATSSTGAGGEEAGSVASTGTNAPTGNGAGGGSPNGVFGLATGGGGCQCDVGARGAAGDTAKMALLAALGLVIGARRRRRSSETPANDGRSAGKEVSR